MELFFSQIVNGLATGSIYGLFALAIVIIYQASAIINFSQAELGMLSTYCAWALIEAGFPYWPAFVITLAIAFIIGVLLQRTAIQPIESAPLMTQLMVNIGLTQILNALAGWIFLYNIKTFPSPFSTKPIQIGHLQFAAQDVGIFGIGFILLILMFLFFEYTTMGIAMRGSSQNPSSARLSGVRVGWMLALGWGLSALIGAATGMLVAPILFLSPSMMSGIGLYAFAAAVLGGLNSPGGAVLGGVIMGIIENLVGTYIPALADIKLVVALLILVLVLLFKPTGLLGKPVVEKV